MKSIKVLIIGLMMCTLTVSPVYADKDELYELRNEINLMKQHYESRIQALEAKIDALESKQGGQVEAKIAELRAEMKQEIEDSSMNVDYVGRYDGAFEKGGLEVNIPSGNTKVTLGGYMDHEFENFAKTDSTFDQHRWIINIGAEIGERLRFFSEYEIEHGGPDAGGEAKVEQAWVEFLINDAINLRTGAILVPFGRTNIYHDSDQRDLTSRPLVARDIIPTTWTESGGGFHGEFNPTIGEYEDLEITYEAYVINGLDDGGTDTGLGGAVGSLESDNNNEKSYVGRVVLSPAIGQEVGISGYWGEYNDFDDEITGIGVDFLSTWGPLELVGEWAQFDVNVPDFAESGITDMADKYQGYRVQANYHFWPEFLDETFLGRKFENPMFTLVNRFGWAKIDNDERDTTPGDNEETRYTLGLNYRPVESVVFKFEYQWNETENEALERGDNNGFFWSVAMGF